VPGASVAPPPRAVKVSCKMLLRSTYLRENGTFMDDSPELLEYDWVILTIHDHKWNHNIFSNNSSGNCPIMGTTMENYMNITITVVGLPSNLT
jgi:hypothetical protein